MKKTALSLLLLFLSTAGNGADDIWESLFREKLREANAGNSNAQFDVGAMYQNGRGVTASRDKAIEWYSKAAAQDNQNAVARLKLLQANKERFARTLELAGRGDVESQYDLGRMYTEGIGVDADVNQAMTWYEKAAAQGNARAEFKLGLACYEGSGVPRDLPRAFALFRRAAEKGYPAAQYYLGRMYADGQGVKRDTQAALDWYSKAADGGFNEARRAMIDLTELPGTQAVASATTVMETASVPAAGYAVELVPQQAAPAYTFDTLMQSSWMRDSSPVPYLPSTISNCSMESAKLVCNSDDQVRDSATGTVRYRTRAIISDLTADGSFSITYRNLVLEATQDTSPARTAGEELIGGITSEPTAMSYEVRTGWSKAHDLECRFETTEAIACVKNRMHAFRLESPQAVARGK